MSNSQISIDGGLSPQQRKHLDLFGYVLCKGIVIDLVPDLLRELDAATSEHDGSERTLEWQFLDRRPSLLPVLERLDPIMASALGDDWQYFSSVGNAYSGTTGWHADSFGHHRRIKIAMYLDPTGPSAGGLSVVPLSQHISESNNDLHLSVGMTKHALGIHGRDVPSVTLTTEPGDALVFNHNLFHSAWDGGPRRRMVSLNGHAAYGANERGVLLDEVQRMTRFLAPTPFGSPLSENAWFSRRLEQVHALTDEYDRALRARLDESTSLAKDLLPDLSDNADEQVVIAELLRDNDYVAPSHWRAVV